VKINRVNAGIRDQFPAQHLSARRQHQHTVADAARPDDEITPVEPIEFNPRERPLP
jgi:hypothetical protein